jgi:hypothetical protein
MPRQVPAYRGHRKIARAEYQRAGLGASLSVATVEEGRFRGSLRSRSLAIGDGGSHARPNSLPGWPP